MDIEIRRNRDLTFTLDGEVNRKAFEELAGRIPPLTEEQRKMLDEFAWIRREIEEKFDKNEVYDLLGDLIVRETHEIGFDFSDPDDDGMSEAKTMWVRPKKSEYEK